MRQCSAVKDAEHPTMRGSGLWWRLAAAQRHLAAVVGVFRSGSAIAMLAAKDAPSGLGSVLRNPAVHSRCRVRKNATAAAFPRCSGRVRRGPTAENHARAANVLRSHPRRSSRAVGHARQARTLTVRRTPQRHRRHCRVALQRLGSHPRRRSSTFCRLLGVVRVPAVRCHAHCERRPKWPRERSTPSCRPFTRRGVRKNATAE